MRSKSKVGDALEVFNQEVGVPTHVHKDGSKEQMHSKFGKVCKKLGIKLTTTEPYSPWQNWAEDAIRELKRAYRRVMLKRDIPAPLWNFVLQWVAET